MRKPSLIIVDDHKLFREMCSQLFYGNDIIEVIAEAGEFDEAIELTKIHQPDILWLDINLSSASGFDAVPLVKRCAPKTKILAVSMHRHPAYAKKMISLGARGYLTKTSPRAEVFNAIRQILDGRKYICSEIKNLVAKEVFSDHSEKHPVQTLTYRETEVVKLIRQGLTSKEIAETLSISVKTVHVHRGNILKKLNQKNTAGLVNFIYRDQGLNFDSQ